MPEHVHVHAPHELSEPGEATTRRERVLELAAVLLMSAATLGIAWSGYQAARWSGHQARHYAEANALHAKAGRYSTLAGQERLQDLLNFNRWLEATTAGDTEIAALYERRFRPEFVPAFKAWVASDPLHNNDSVATPLLEPEYRLDNFVRSDELEKQATERFDEGKDATEQADTYVFITVFMAAVLFFAGMSMRFAWTAMRITVLVIAGVFLMYGVARLATLPTL
jgi:hypothetical protein